MLKIIGNDIIRNGQKVGWVESNHIHAHDGKKLGYFDDNFVYDSNGRKLAYIERDHLCSGDIKMPLDKVNENVVGGILPEMGKCAVYVLMGA